MPRYRKRPIEVEAIVWTGDNDSEVREFVFDHAPVASQARWIVHSDWTSKPQYAEVWVAKSQAMCRVELRGAVVAEPDGQGVYPNTPEQFEANFERVS